MRTVLSPVAPNASITRYRNESCPDSPAVLVYTIDMPSAEMAADPCSGWVTMLSSRTTSPSGSMPNPSNGIETDSPLATRPDSREGSGSRFVSSETTRTRTVPRSPSAGAPVEKAR